MKFSPDGPISNEHCDWLYGIFGHETSCTRYWTCWNGTATEQLCIGGLLYNENAHSCDWPEVSRFSKLKYHQIEKARKLLKTSIIEVQCFDLFFNCFFSFFLCHFHRMLKDARSTVSSSYIISHL
jgi:hypothetical protein